MERLNIARAVFRVGACGIYLVTLLIFADLTGRKGEYGIKYPIHSSQSLPRLLLWL